MFFGVFPDTPEEQDCIPDLNDGSAFFRLNPIQYFVIALSTDLHKVTSYCYVEVVILFSIIETHIFIPYSP